MIILTHVFILIKMYLNYTFILIKMCFDYTFIKMLGFLYKKILSLQCKNHGLCKEMRYRN